MFNVATVLIFANHDWTNPSEYIYIYVYIYIYISLSKFNSMVFFRTGRYGLGPCGHLLGFDIGFEAEMVCCHGLT